MNIIILGIPDVPNGDITAALRTQQKPSLTVINEGIISNVYNTKLPTSTHSSLVSIEDLSKQSIHQPIKLTLKITLLDSLTVQWESLLINEILYVYIADPPTGNSKEAFIDLLEFAEEELHCKKVIVYLDKQNPDRSKIYIILIKI